MERFKEAAQGLKPASPKSSSPLEGPGLRTSIILDNNISGYLRNQGKVGRAVGIWHKRYYRLDGAVLSKHQTEQTPPIWHANVVGATVTPMGKQMFSLTIRDASASAEEARVVLNVRTEEECKRWVECLHSAATRTLEGYYHVGEVIGEGGFATVRIGQCKRTSRIVAIKTMKKQQEYMQLFGQEIAILKRVDHINIVRTFDLFETDKKLHFVMEYMKGGMLFNAIEDGVAFTETDVAQLMREILHGVLYLHDHGIVHRDIKPENVLCTDKKPPFLVKIADFGLSKFAQNNASCAELLMKTMIGTPEFIAPEIALAQEYTSKVDMWAVGMLMYNVVTGHLPFDDNEKDFVGKLRSGLKLTFPEQQWKCFSPEAVSFTRGLLSAKPERRLTALAALVHPWLDDVRRIGSSRVAAHGRFSRAVACNGDTMPENEDIARRTTSAFFPMPLRARTVSWLVVYLAVKAANRFLSLVQPDRPIRMMRSVSRQMEELETPREDERSSPESCRRSNGSKRDTKRNSPNLGLTPSSDLLETVESPSSRAFTSLIRSLQGGGTVRISGRDDDREQRTNIKTPETLSPKDLVDGATQVRKAVPCSAKAEAVRDIQVDVAQRARQESNTGRKASGMLKVGSRKMSSRLAELAPVPSRARSGLSALHKKFTLHGDKPEALTKERDEAVAVSSSSPASMDDGVRCFDLSLDLDVSSVEDSPVHEASLDGPATFHGTKHRAMMADNSNNSSSSGAVASAGGRGRRGGRGNDDRSADGGDRERPSDSSPVNSLRAGQWRRMF